MGSAIGMDDWSCRAICHGLDSCIQHSIDQPRVWLRSNRPTDDHAIEAVDDRGTIHLPSRDLELGGVCQPLHIRRFCMGVAIDQVLGCRTYFSRV